MQDLILFAYNGLISLQKGMGFGAKAILKLLY